MVRMDEMKLTGIVNKIANEEERSVFDNEPKRISIEDASRIFNAKYLQGNRPYETDESLITQGAIQEFATSVKKMPSQLKMAYGQTQYALGSPFFEEDKQLMPKGGSIFYGTTPVDFNGQLRESGRINIETANRNLERLDRELDQLMPNISPEDRERFMYQAVQQAPDYALMLALSYVNPYLGMGYMSAKTLGQETEEGATKYKQKFGTIEGFEQYSGDELLMNVANTAMQSAVEKIGGVPGQLKVFKNARDIARTAFIGGAEEFVTENVQNLIDAGFDHISGRLEKDETIASVMMDNFKGTLVAAMFGGASGMTFAINNRANGIKMYEDMLDGSDVPVEKRSFVAENLYNENLQSMQEVITKELELDSQLRAKHGSVMDAMKEAIDKQYRDAGAFNDKTESEIAQMVNSKAKEFADITLSEAHKRNTLIENVVNSKNIEYKDGQMYLTEKRGDGKGSKLFQEAYAGSRVDYDRPSLEAIGTGEGSQVHGYGLYYALNKDVAEGYRKRFKTNKPDFNSSKINEIKKDINQHDVQKFKLLDEIDAHGTTATERHILKKYDQNVQEWYKSIRNKIRNKEGQLVRVDVPENPYLLDEQLPFNEQSDFVKEAINKLYNNEFVDKKLDDELLDKIVEDIGYYSDNTFGRKSEYMSSARQYIYHGKQYAIDIVNLEHSGSVSDAYMKEHLLDFIEKLDDKLDVNSIFKNYIPTPEGVGYDIYEDISRRLGSDKEASELLNKYGIKGITYYGGRDGRCFVIFNPDDITMLEKYYGAEKGLIKSEKETQSLIQKINEIQKAEESGKEIDSVKAQNENRNVLEFNVETFNDPESMKYMIKRMHKRNMTKDEINDFISYMKDVAENVMEMSGNKEHKRFSEWNKRQINRYKEGRKLLPIISAFKKNGDYPLNFDLSSLCTRREATNNVVKYLIEKGYAQRLGSTQLEAIKDVLKKADFTTACDICFVESKRLRLLTIANTFAYEWQSVRMAMGLTDENPVGTIREFTPEQMKILDQMSIMGDKNESIRQKAYDKYIPEERKRVKLGDKYIDSGITASKMFMIAKLFKQDPSLAGVFEPEWLLSNQGYDWLLKKYVNTDIRSVLSSMFGTATPKPIEGFNIYDPLSWVNLYDSNNKADKLLKVFTIGGFRGQSFSDFNSLQAFDYFQFFCDLYIRGLPIHMYTKVPALIKLFGKTGGMFNMSVVPEMVKGVDKAHAGLRKATEEEIKNGKSQEGFKLESDEHGTWTYAFSKDSFPIDEAFSLRKKFDNAGIIAVGVSDMQIKMMMNDPDIDMIIPYHLSGISLHTRIKTGLDKANFYDDVQNTGKPKKAHDFSYNKGMMEIGDPRKVAQAYVDWCLDNEYKPKFQQFIEYETKNGKIVEVERDGKKYPQIKKDSGYYKLLEDFRGYDNKGNPIIQEAVNMKNINAKEFSETLDSILTDREKEVGRQEKLYENEEVKTKIDKILSKQRLDGVYRDALMERLSTSLGKDNVISLRQEEFFDQMKKDLIELRGIQETKKIVEVFRNRDGIVYGYAKDNQIILNENVFNANTPAHEFTHIWSRVARNINPKLWNQGKDLLKSYKPNPKSDETLWDIVKKDPLYSNLKGDEDAIASEVLARIVGEENEKFVTALIDPKLKPLRDKDVVTKRIMDWFKKLWGEIRSIFDDFNGKPLTFEEFVHMPLKDLWDETRNMQFNKSLDQTSDYAEPSYYQGGKRGKVKGSYDYVTKSIKITNKADFSTYSHEFAHFWLDNMWEYANSGQASEEYLKQFQAVRDWLGVGARQKYFTREQHEKFARGYEKFLLSGITVKPIIASVFDDYDKYLRDVYDDLASIDEQAGKEYEEITPVMYDFFNSMISGELPKPDYLVEKETIKDVQKEEAKVTQDAKEVNETQKVYYEEERKKFSNEPVGTDYGKSYLRAYERMTGEQVSAKTTSHDEQYAKAKGFVYSNPYEAKRVIDGLQKEPDGILRNAIYIAYNELMKKTGNTEERVKSMLNQAMELRRYGQEIESQKILYNAEEMTTPEFWIREVMRNRTDALAKANKMSVLELNNLINEKIKPVVGDLKAVKKIAKELRERLGVTELFQSEFEPQESNVSSYNYVYKYVNEQLGLSISNDDAKVITQKADEMRLSLENSESKNGNPSVDYFVKLKEMEDFANSIAPSSELRVAVSVIGKGNLMFSLKSPTTNIVSNAFVAGYRAIVRRMLLGQTKSIVDPDLIKRNKTESWDIFKRTGYNLNNMTEESPRHQVLGEHLTHSQGEGNIRKMGRLWESIVYKWSLGAPDLWFKDLAFNDYVSLKATKEANGDVNKANEIYLDAIKINPETDLGKQIRKDAIEESLISTYQNNSWSAKTSIKARSLVDFGFGFGEFIAPFVKTPANVIEMGLKSSFGGIYAIADEAIRDVKAGKVLPMKEGNVALCVENGIGLLLAYVLSLAFDEEDYMPSYLLASTQDRKLAKELKIPFNAIRIGDKWISLDYFGPLSSTLSAILQLKREESVLDGISGYVKAGGQQAISLPGLGNISDLFSGLKNITHKKPEDVLSDTFNNVAEATIARVIPAISSDIAKAFDNYEREASTLTEKVEKKIPFVRQNLQKKINMTTGRPETIDNAFWSLFAGSRVKTQEVNTLAREFQKLNDKGFGVNLTDVTRSGLLSKVDDEQKAKIKKEFAVIYSQKAREIISSSSYKQADDEKKRDMIDSARRKIVEDLKKKYLKKK